MTFTVAVLIVSSSACGEFDPESADLPGTWRISDSTFVSTPDGPFNTCLVRNLPILIHDGPDSAMLVQTRPGGSLQCEINGVWRDPQPYDPNYHYSLSRTGDSVRMRFPQGDTVYVGRLSSDNRMNGLVHPQGRGRQGTWRARRE
jgi:hypothetical protein